MVASTPIKNAVKTTRPSRSLLLFIVVIVGYVVVGFDWRDALVGALPMLSISLAGFCINDIFDQELDRINHPDRTLAKYPALTSSATTIYVCLFVTSVLLISIQDSHTERFIWAIFFILLSNYNFFKRSFPIAKNAYVAIAACLPVSVLDLAHDERILSTLLYGPIFVAVFARELACDIPDIEGDTGTLAKKLSRKYSFQFVVFLYLMALALTFLLSTTNLATAASLVGLGALGLYLLARMVLGWPEKSLLVFSGTIAISPAFLIVS